MSPARTAPALTPDFTEETLVFRGISYKLRELSIGDYDDLVKKATVKRTRPNPLTSEPMEVEETDNVLLLKMMVLKVVVDPRLNAESLAGLPMRVVYGLNKAVNEMHYGDEAREEPSTNGAAPAEEAEEEAKGEG